MENLSLEELIEMAYPAIREITFHTSGEVIAKTGAKAKHPKKLYGSPKLAGTMGEKSKIAVIKLIKDNNSQ